HRAGHRVPRRPRPLQYLIAHAGRLAGPPADALEAVALVAHAGEGEPAGRSEIAPGRIIAEQPLGGPLAVLLLDVDLEVEIVDPAQPLPLHRQRPGHSPFLGIAG